MGTDVIQDASRTEEERNAVTRQLTPSVKSEWPRRQENLAGHLEAASKQQEVYTGVEGQRLVDSHGAMEKFILGRFPTAFGMQLSAGAGNTWLSLGWFSRPLPPPRHRCSQGSSLLMAILHNSLLSLLSHQQCPLLGTSSLSFPLGLFHSPPGTLCAPARRGQVPPRLHCSSWAAHALSASHFPDQDVVWHLFLTSNMKPCLMYSLNKGFFFLTN